MSSLIQKYTWLVKTIARAGRITLRDIQERWKENVDLSRGEKLPRQTFDRWKNGVCDLFGIIIECEKGGRYRYYIDNPEVMAGSELQAWLLKTYGTADALASCISLKNRILTEDIPSSHGVMTDILEAMKANEILNVTYRSFTSVAAHTFPIAPYCLKMFGRRWYVLALSAYKDQLRIYSLDRMTSVSCTGEHFKMPQDFDANVYFQSFFGIVMDESVPMSRVVVRANGDHQHYMRSLPLHPSQREIDTCNEYADFELMLRPTYDFVMELLRYGAMVEVLQPQSLRETMRGWIADMASLY